MGWEAAPQIGLGTLVGYLQLPSPPDPVHCTSSPSLTAALLACSLALPLPSSAWHCLFSICESREPPRPPASPLCPRDSQLPAQQPPWHKWRGPHSRMDGAGDLGPTNNRLAGHQVPSCVRCPTHACATRLSSLRHYWWDVSSTHSRRDGALALLLTCSAPPPPRLLQPRTLS